MVGANRTYLDGYAALGTLLSYGRLFHTLNHYPDELFNRSRREQVDLWSTSAFRTITRSLATPN